MLYTGYIAQILEQLEQNPALARKSLRTAWEQTTPEEFRLAAVPLVTDKDGTGQRFLVSFLLQHDALEKRLGDHLAFTKEEALAMGRAAHRVDPSLDVKLAMQLAGKTADDEKDAGRILEILEVISQPASLLPLLGNIIHHSNPKVRSKAALLMGKGNRNAAWVKQQLSEPNERVRANAVESLWGVEGEDVIPVFLAASHNRDQRTAINGMLGLYLCRRTESVQLLAEAAQQANGGFRASAAWGMGRTQDPRFLPLLAKLVRDPEPLVRSNALKAVSKIRSYRKLLESAGQFRIWMAASSHDDGWRELKGVVRTPGRAIPLNPLHYVVEEGGRPVLHYEFSGRPEADGAAGLALPHAADLEETLAGEIGQAWKQVMAEKRPGDSFNVAHYANCVEGQPAAPFTGFVPALSSLFHQLPQKEQRALVVVGSPASESTDVVMKRQGQLERLIEEARQTGVRIHAIVPPVCAPIMRVALHEAARGTGGRYIEASREETFQAAIVSLVLGMFPAFQIRYRLEEPHAPKVRLMVYSPGGAGECEVELVRE